MTSEVLNKKYILANGVCKALPGDTPDVMEIEGWASTTQLDYEGHVIPSTAFNKNFDAYLNEGRYWYNHDGNTQIGKVLAAHIVHDQEVSGMYIDKAKLSATDFVKGTLWPLVKDGAVNEHSISFLSLAPRYDKKEGILYHDDVRVLETSIVSLACNPGAMITGRKSMLVPEEYWKCYKDIPDEYMLLIEKGELTLDDVYRMSCEGKLKMKEKSTNIV